MSKVPTAVNFPKPGMGIDDGTVLAWTKKVGERVQAGDVLLEVETAKAVQEITAPVSGVLIQILASPGQAVRVNSTLGVIEGDKD